MNFFVLFPSQRIHQQPFFPSYRPRLPSLLPNRCATIYDAPAAFAVLAAEYAYVIGTQSLGSGAATPDVLINAAGHTIRGAGEIRVDLVNQGTLTADVNGEKLKLSGTTITNESTIDAINGGILQVLSNATLNNTNGIVSIADDATFDLSSSGTVSGGSVVGGGSTGAFLDGTGGTLEAVTLTGTLKQAFGGRTSLKGIITNNGLLTFEGKTTTSSDEVLLINDSVTLTGTGELVLVEESDSLIGQHDQFIGSGAATPDVLINAAGHTIRGAGEIRVDLVNQGTLIADVSTEKLKLTSTLTNFNNGTNTLNGGTFGAANGGLLQFNDANIDINQAEIILDGVGSMIVNQTGTYALPDLAVNDNGAALRIVGNRDFTTTADFTNRGELELGGGMFNANSIDNQAAGAITGFGAVGQRPTNAGTIRSTGGTLAFSAGIAGTGGTIEALAGSTVDISAGGSNSSAGTQDSTKRCAAKSFYEGLVNLAGSDAARGGCSEEQLPLAAD